MSRTTFPINRNRRRQYLTSRDERSQYRVSNYLENFLTLPKTDYTYADTGTYRSQYIERDYEIPNMTRHSIPSDYHLRDTSSIHGTPDTSPMRLRSGSVLHSTPAHTSYHHTSHYSSHQSTQRYSMIHGVRAFVSWWVEVVRALVRWLVRRREKLLATSEHRNSTAVTSMYGLDVDGAAVSEDTQESKETGTTTITKTITTTIETIIHPIDTISSWWQSRSTHRTAAATESLSKHRVGVCLPCCCVCLIPILLLFLLGLVSLLAVPPTTVIINNSTTQSDVWLSASTENQLLVLIDRVIEDKLVAVRREITDLTALFWSTHSENRDRILTKADVEAVVGSAISASVASVSRDVQALRQHTSQLEQQQTQMSDSGMSESAIKTLISSLLASKMEALQNDILYQVEQQTLEQANVQGNEREAAFDEINKRLTGMLASIDLLTKDVAKSKEDMKLYVEAKGDELRRAREDSVRIGAEETLTTLRGEINALRVEMMNQPAVINQAGSSGGFTPGTDEKLQRIVSNALLTFSADKTGMADYALESAGGSIVSTLCSETYSHKTALISVWGIPLFYQSYSPRTVIQVGVNPGECWAYRGPTGHLVIKLARSIRPTIFTLEHIPKSLVTGSINSAPRDFTVYGLLSEDYSSRISLGNYTYDVDLPNPMQNFIVQATDVPVIQYIWLTVKNNYGNLHYTCIYRFRVHGTPPSVK